MYRHLLGEETEMGPGLFDSNAQIGSFAASGDLVSLLTKFLAKEERQRRRDWASGQTPAYMAGGEVWTQVFCSALGRPHSVAASSI